MHEALMANLTTFLAKNDLVDVQLTEHRSAGNGKCSCSTPNVPRPWPCTTGLAAQLAAEMAALRPMN